MKCKVEGCENKATRKGMCQTHYARVWRNGKIELKTIEERKKPEQKYCCIEGCNNIHFGHGYCSTHYMRYKRNGNPLEINKKGRKKGKKNMINCDKEIEILKRFNAEGVNYILDITGLMYYSEEDKIKGENIINSVYQKAN